MKHYIFDTNILLSNKKDLVDLILELKNDDSESYVAELSIQELKGHNYRDIKVSIESIDKIIRSSVGQYLKFKNTIDVKNAKKLSDVKIDAYIKTVFEENIIPLNVSNHKIEIILNRANEKIAPFNIESSSDKGFKDTLLWLSILDFYKDKKDIEVLFVTNDSVFKKYETNIQSEFSECTKLKIQIINNASIIKSKNEKSIEPKKEVIKSHSIDIFEVDLAIERFLYSNNFDSYGNEYLKRNFSVYQTLDNDDIKNFLEYLKTMLYTKYSLFKMISLHNIFNNIEVKSSLDSEVDRNVCIKLIDLYELMRFEDDVLFESFIELLKEKFNSLFEYDPENLPF